MIKMKKPIMVFNITINRDDISFMEAPYGKAMMIPFGGTVESELFTGKVLPGACDVQITNAAGIRHMCAQYMFEGTDKEGKACHLFVKNDGYFEPHSNPQPFKAYPTLMTDSGALAPYFSQARFRAEGHSTDNGVDIYIFDTLE